MCIVCVYSFAKGNTGPRFCECWGHNFGHVSSVCNYNCTSIFCCQVARCFFNVPQEHYVDDYCTPDFKLADIPDCGAVAALSALHNVLGFKLAPDKQKSPSDKPIFLSVNSNVSHVTDPDPYVEFTPSARRTDLVIEMLYNASKQGLDQHTVQVIKGKIGSILQSVWGCVARAAIQPLVSCCGKKLFLLPGRVQPPPTWFKVG